MFRVRVEGFENPSKNIENNKKTEPYPNDKAGTVKNKNCSKLYANEIQYNCMIDMQTRGREYIYTAALPAEFTGTHLYE